MYMHVRGYISFSTVRVHCDVKQMVHAVESVVVEWSHQVYMYIHVHVYSTSLTRYLHPGLLAAMGNIHVYM